MPNGVVQWVDPSTGDGLIMHSGRRYPVAMAAIKPHARHARARVHFDIERRDGVPVAVNVVFRPGKRVSHRQGRFSDLAGAHQPDSRASWPHDRFEAEVGHQRQRQPVRVARRWAELMAAGAAQDAVLLYAPNAVLHAGGEVVVGSRRIRTSLEASPLLGGPAPQSMHTVDGRIVLRWPVIRPEGGAAVVQLRVQHGTIVEHWEGAASLAALGGPPVPTVTVTGGAIGRRVKRYAAESIAKVLRTVDGSIRSATIRLDHAGDAVVAALAAVERGGGLQWA